ncbi:MAG TPA: helix-turn-helix domain-containing protein [Candidatus Acidoferrales bacterium]|jgi:excisionase family DNA binding protein|nr:helix-turn-helix domain-containing protein [Candidatus Acidoferrales bacterium]
MKKRKKQITYDQAAKVLDCSPRNVRLLIKRHGIEPIRLGHRTVRLPLETIIRLRTRLVLDL